MSRFILATLIGIISVGWTHGVSPAITYLGQAATRSATASHFTGNSCSGAPCTYVQTNSAAFIRVGTGNTAHGCVLGLPGWYLHDNSTGAARQETSFGANTTVTAAVWVNGSPVQVKFSGSATGTVPDGATLISDVFDPNAADGAKVFVRIWAHNTVGLPLGDISRGLNTGIGDASVYSSTVITDQTMSGTVTYNFNGRMYWPVVFACQTTQPSVCGTGDSRMLGTDDTNDSTGDLGDTFRSVGQWFGYISMAEAGTTIVEFISSHTNQVAIINAYCTHIINELGGADGWSSVPSNLPTLWGYFPTKKVFQNTFEPFSTSTDSWATVINQTQSPVGGTAAQWAAMNTYIRGTPAPLVGFFDIAATVGTSANFQLWQVTGSAFGYTADGVHETQAGYLLIPAANAIPKSAFVYP